MGDVPVDERREQLQRQLSICQDCGLVVAIGTVIRAAIATSLGRVDSGIGSVLRQLDWIIRHIG